MGGGPFKDFTGEGGGALCGRAVLAVLPGVSAPSREGRLDDVLTE